MRPNKLILIVIAFLVVSNCNAVEPILEPHAMLYVKIPLGSRHKDTMKPSFGFRMDTALVEPGKPINYPKLFNRQAILDLRMGRAGIEELKISGVDYLKRIRTLHANGDDSGAPADDAGAAEQGQASPDQGGAETAEKKGGIFSKLPDYSNSIKKTQYLGLIVGVMAGVGFLMGI